MRRFLPFLLFGVLGASSSAAAQSVASDSQLVARIKSDVHDSILALQPKLNLRSKRAIAHVLARGDSINANGVQLRVDTVRVERVRVDTLRLVRVDTVRRVDTVYATKPPEKPPVDTSAPPAPPVVITPGGSSVFAPHPFAPLPNGALYAELPRESVTVVVPAPTRTIVVSNLQAALDTAQTGDLLKLPARSSSSCLLVKETARAGWVTVQGTDSTSVITCAVGGATSTIGINSRAHHVRFLGPLRITTGTSATNAIVRSYNAETSAADQAHDVIFDGVTIDADTFEVRRCAWPDGIRMAIVNSKLLNCASRSGDAQAIEIGNGPGPYRFQSNWLEGGHQCVMSGGFDPAFKGNIPSDVYVADNTCYKRPEWHYTIVNGAKDYSGKKRQVKTIFETKFIRRALYERNRCLYVWADAQAGFGGLFKSENQDGGNPTAQTVDVTFRYNHCVGMANGINIAAHPGSQPAVALARFTAYGNVFDSLSTAGGEGKPVQLLDAINDVVLMENTFQNATNDAISFDGASGIRTSVLRNVIPAGAYGVKGSGNSTGTNSIKAWITNAGGLFLNNVIVGSDCSLYPATTTCSLPAPAGVGADRSKVPQ